MVAIKFDNISKQYRLGLVSTKTVSHDLNRWFTTKILRKEDPYLKIGEVNDRSVKGNSDYVWALRDINFEIKQGDVLGIIGKNGAGKSTLLKILSKVTTPTTGVISARGRIASLLEVGTGFHPEMTGRENIYMNGSIMGMTKVEISRKLDEIVDFAGVERYIDTPVKRYSSGMTVRLGFAIAAHLEPEILVVDEVLAVGDAEFQKKAIGKMQDVSRGEGRTVLFVSHNMGAVKNLCNTGIILKNGTLDFIGTSNQCIEHYLSNKNESVKSQVWTLNNAPQQNGIKLLSAKLNTKNEQIYAGDELEFEFVFENMNESISRYDITFHIMDEMDNIVFEASTNFSERKEQKTNNGIYKANCKVYAGLMNEGHYRISRLFFVKDDVMILFYIDNIIYFDIERRPNVDGVGYQGEKMGIVKPNLNWNYSVNDKEILK
jgi:lipopolysaccharide transport system ATP-binding protein